MPGLGGHPSMRPGRCIITPAASPRAGRRLPLLDKRKNAAVADICSLPKAFSTWYFLTVPPPEGNFLPSKRSKELSPRSTEHPLEHQSVDFPWEEGPIPSSFPTGLQFSL